MKIYIAVSSVDDWAGMMTQGSAYNLYPVMLESVPTDTPKPYYFCLDYLHELGHSSFPHTVKLLHHISYKASITTSVAVLCNAFFFNVVIDKPLICIA